MKCNKTSNIFFVMCYEKLKGGALCTMVEHGFRVTEPFSVPCREDPRGLIVTRVKAIMHYDASPTSANRTRAQQPVQPLQSQLAVAISTSIKQNTTSIAFMTINNMSALTCDVDVALNAHCTCLALK